MKVGGSLAGEVAGNSWLVGEGESGVYNVVTIGGQRERSLGKKTGTQQINRSGVGTVGWMDGLKNRRGVV